MNGYLFTAGFTQTIDWEQISWQIHDALLATPMDDFEQGYWVDINQAVPLGKK